MNRCKGLAITEKIHFAVVGFTTASGEAIMGDFTVGGKTVRPAVFTDWDKKAKEYNQIATL